MAGALMTDARTCLACRFFVAVPAREVNAQMKGRCHRLSPQRTAFAMNVQGGGTAIAESTDWPGISGASWCGEWAAKADGAFGVMRPDVQNIAEAWPRSQGEG